MDQPTMWWLLAGALVAIEMVTGTFYLLMLALGVAAAALAAHMHLSMALQLVSAATIGGGAVLAWHQINKARPGDPPANADRNANLDIGELVMIEGWAPDGTALVKYRGAQWTAITRQGITPSTGMHRVAELVGNRLLVDPA